MSHARSPITLCIAVAAFLLAGGAAAQSAPPPKGLEPLPDVPPPPKLSNTTPTPADDEDAPTVNIRQEGDTKIEEFRTKEGRVYAIRVTPRVGKAYMLVDPDGKHPITSTGDIGTGTRPAQWTLFEF